MCNNTQKKKAAGAGKDFTLFFGVMLHFNFKCVGEKRINLASILERNRTLRTQEKRFRALKCQNFLGSMLPDTARDSHPRRPRDAIRILYYLKNKSRFYVLKRLDSPSLTSCGLIRDGLFTNWKLGFDSDPLLHDLQPSCS